MMLDRIIKEFYRRNPIKRTHGTVIGAFKIGAGIKAVTIMEFIVILTAAAFGFAVMSRSIRICRLMPHSKLR